MLFSGRGVKEKPELVALLYPACIVSCHNSQSRNNLKMKKIASIVLLVFAFTLTTQAQKGKKKMRAEKLSTEQQTILAVKKMTLALDLTTSQQNQLKPLIAKKKFQIERHSINK
jgi:hypothetical protein